MIKGRLGRSVTTAVCGAALVVVSCTVVPGDGDGGGAREAGPNAPRRTASGTSIGESAAAAARIAQLRRQFRVPSVAEADTSGGMQRAAHLEAATRPALGEPAAARFAIEPGDAGVSHVVASFLPEVIRSVRSSARVALPMSGAREVALEDGRSRLSIRFALERMRDAPFEIASGLVLYRGAYDGADVVHRVHPEGTEDFVVFETPPAQPELRYAIDVSRAPGLRLVSNTLEFLDETGAPLLRVDPPWVVSANGEVHAATLGVEACAYDAIGNDFAVDDIYLGTQTSIPVPK